MLLAQYRLRVDDPELKQGQVETYPQKYGLKQPMAFPGGFAIVYKFRTRSGKPLALRVFQRRIASDIQERYELLGPFLSKHAPEITTRFMFHETGIRVQDTTNTKRDFPLITMDWVEGPTLLSKVDQLCGRGDSAALEGLADRWKTLMAVMRGARMAHGDLAAGNVMVRPNGSLVLIDYDGMYIPPLQGRQAVVGGQPDYQHPGFNSGRGFDEGQDDFSWLVIYTALLALAENPALWTEFTKRAEDSKLLNDNLLFQEKDFLAPGESVVFRRLRKLAGKELNEALGELEGFCLMQIDKIALRPELWQFDRLEQQALKLFLSAIGTDDDGEVERAWVPCLHEYPAVPPDARKRARAAVARMGYLRKLYSALAADSDQAIAKAWRKWFDTYPKVSALQRKRAQEALQRWEAYEAFRAAVESHDDREIAKADLVKLDRYDGFSLEERQLLQRARRCVAMPAKVRAALVANDDDALLEAWDGSLIRSWSGFSPDEAEEIAKALRRAQTLSRLRVALASDDDEVIAKTSEPWRKSQGNLTESEWKRIQLAHERWDAVTTFRAALAVRDEREIVQAYGPILDGFAGVSAEEREVLDRARQCVEMPMRVRQALVGGNDDELAKVWDADLNRRWSSFTETEVSAIAETLKRVHALPRLKLALASDDDRAIARVWNHRFEASSSLTQDQQGRALLAVERVDALDTFLAAVESQDDRAIVQAYRPVLDGYAGVKVEHREILERARRCVAMPEAVRAALQAQDDDAVMRLWDGGLLRTWSGFTPAEIDQIARVLRRMQALPQLKAALDTGDDCEIANAWKPWLEESSCLTNAERARALEAIERQDVLTAFRKAVATGDERQIVEAYRPVLVGSRGVMEEERTVLQLARRCVAMPGAVREALAAEDDERLYQVWDSSLVRPWSGFTPAESKEIAEALQRIRTWPDLREALASDADEQIVSAWKPWFDGSRLLSEAQHARVQLALERREALIVFRQALATRDERKVVQQYRPILDDFDEITVEERETLARAQRCITMPDRVRAALAAKDEQTLLEAWDASLVRSWSSFTPSEVDEIRRILLSQTRHKSTGKSHD